MINLAWRDVSHGFGRYVATGLGLGLLIGVTLSMAGVLRGMIADGRALLEAVDVDLWVVQRGTLGPFAEPSAVPTALRDAVQAMPGVAAAGSAGAGRPGWWPAVPSAGHVTRWWPTSARGCVRATG